MPFFNRPLIYGAAGFGLIVLFAVINFFGHGLVKLVNNVSAAAKILTLIILIVVGVFFIHKANFSPVIPQAALKGPINVIYSSFW